MYDQNHIERISKEEEDYLLSKKDTDKEAREKLILSNIKLVISIASKFKYKYKNIYEDIEQVGIIGLIKGIDAFDPNTKYALSTFLTVCILNQIRMFLRSYNKCSNILLCDYDMIYGVIDDKQENEFKKIDDLDLINDIYNSLSESDILLLKLYYEHGLNQIDIARIIGISQANTSRMFRKVYKKIRKSINID